MLSRIVSPDDKIRRHPIHGTPSAAIMKVKNPRQTWKSIKQNNPLIEQHIRKLSARGGDVEYLTIESFNMMIASLRSNKKSSQEVLQHIREAALEIASRYWQSDPTIATDIIDKTKDSKVLNHIAQRAQVKVTQRLMTDQIKECGGVKQIFAVINDKNNIAVTGQNADQLVLLRNHDSNKKISARDFFSTEELIEMQFLELSAARALKKHKPNGNDQIVRVHAKVVHKFKDFVNNN